MDAQFPVAAGGKGQVARRSLIAPVYAGVNTRVAVSYSPASGLLTTGLRRRTFAAMLEVIAGDTRRLLTPGLSPRHRTGIHARIAAALGILPLVARRYLQVDSARERVTLARLGELRRAFAAGKLARLAINVGVMAREFPLHTRGLMPTDVTPGQIRIAARLYQSTCMGCHQFHNATSARPAMDLFAAAHRMPPAEFLARMIDGVHGTAFTSFANPLAQAEIAAMYAYFIKTSEPAEN